MAFGKFYFVCFDCDVAFKLNVKIQFMTAIDDDDDAAAADVAACFNRGRLS